MKMVRFILLVLVFFLPTVYTRAQVVQYEYRRDGGYSRGKYVVLQIDHSKKRFVYRINFDGYDASGLGLSILGYVEMYGVFEEIHIDRAKFYPAYKKDYLHEYEMEIYDWLYMKPTNDYREFYPVTSKSIKDEGNPRMLFWEYPNDSIHVGYSNILESEYVQFYSMFEYLGVSLKRSKKIKPDKKRYGKELYQLVVKEREKLIYNDEVFSPHDDFYTRIYKWGLFPVIQRD